ncbi:uronate isomerase [Amylibacter marinus]|uniref:Uronate isomerase n=1 Tax=Amylibacter marinus TaxID=1475483 RepID=A0ABQ5VS96_9RHOB|nr:glucuronate isomerase [Amylibacter marinus]GLQ33988.1 uronate isomerase [Amylibacter marinus]
MPKLHPDRLFPADPTTRAVARALYQSIAELPIISPHGHCDPSWFSNNQRFIDPAQLFVTPDHYVYRMLVSQGLTLDQLGVARADNTTAETDPRKIWRLFADNYHLFRATPSQMWLDYAFENIFGIDEPLNSSTADLYYSHIEHCLGQDAYRPRALFERQNIELLATTESALDTLEHHAAIQDSDWSGRVITTYRPDSVVDPDFEGFSDNLQAFGAITGQDTQNWQGYLAAHKARRVFFKNHGATASDHGHPSACTADLSPRQAEQLFTKICSGDFTADDAEIFRGQMLTEMAKMSLEDGLVLQIHPGSIRNHSSQIFQSHGRDKGFDIAQRTDFATALRPLLDAVGMEPDLTVIIFTLNESAYGRELAPMAGVYPALKLGPPWWFFDSPEGIRRFRESTTETCGFYNTVGFNDDTRAFCSISARHDVARRSDCAYLAHLVSTARLDVNDAHEVAYDLAYGLAKSAYRL